MDPDVDYRPVVIRDEDRAAVTRLVSRDYPEDAPRLLSMLFGEIGPAVGRGTGTERRRWASISPEERARILELHGKGFSQRRIEAATGLSRPLVRAVLTVGAA